MIEPTLPSPTEPVATTPAAGRKVLERMLDRLFASLVNGPSINCRPHRSRQRIDWHALSALHDVAPVEALRELLGDGREVVLRARAPKAAVKSADRDDDNAGESPLVDQPTDVASDMGATGRRYSGDLCPDGADSSEATPTEHRSPEYRRPVAPGSDVSDVADGAKPQATAAPAGDDVGAAPRSRRQNGPKTPEDEQNALLQKLHIIADDARTYEQDTGVHVLNVGFPLLSLPPSFAATASGRQSSRRILAPIAFIPVTLTLRRGATRSVEIAARGDGVDLVTPNTALLAWLQRQTGRAIDTEIFADEKGENPWRELSELVSRVCALADLEIPEGFATPSDGSSSPNAANAPAIPAPNAATPGAVPPGRAPEAEPASPSQTDSATPAPESTATPILAAPPTETADATTTFAPTTQTDPATPADDDFSPLPEESDDLGDTDYAPPSKPAATAPRADAVPALELQPAPRTEELDDSAQIVLSAVLGLFPMANQGLLRDMQELIDDPTKVRGPLAGFVRVGDLLDRPASVGANDQAPAWEASRQSTAIPLAGTDPYPQRSFVDERLIAAADPCQARAVRQARQSTALVIHGPPGTGKSQTIANIIGDHLSRGERVLFVCEKRTALDVVADRLDHMGLGSLIGVVHDPQRDQRELYKKIRDQLDNLHEADERLRSQKKLGEIDEELQSLHAELSNYRAALVRQDEQTGYSFHELMGQWLAASPPAVLSGSAAGQPQLQWRVTLPKSAEAELAKTRLRDLSPLEHPLAETFTRGLKVALAKNPWRSAAGASLATFLAKPVEQCGQEIAAVVAAANVVDETSRDLAPLLPPFTAGLDLAAQASARMRLLEQVSAMLDQTPPEVLDRWAMRDLAAIKAAKVKVTEALPYLSAMKQQVPEPELKSRWLAAHGRDLPAVKDLTQQRTGVQKYADAFGMSMQWVDQIRQKAPQAPWPVIARWMSTETSVAANILSRLEPATPLAQRASSTPLDAELMAQYRRKPFDIQQVLRWQSAVETYLPIARSWLGFLHGAKKKAAMPAMEFFGLGLSFESASRVRDFLSGLRARLEIQEIATKALGPQVFADGSQLPEDAELLGVVGNHRAVMRAAADLHRPHLPAGATAADPTALVNQMVSTEHSAAAPMFQLLGLEPTSQNAVRIVTLLNALIVRVVLQNANENALDAPTPDDLMDDQDLEISIRGHGALFDVALAAAADPLTKDVWPVIAAALVDRAKLLPQLDAIRLSPKRAADILALQKSMTSSQLFAAAWLAAQDAALRRGDAFTPVAAALRQHLPTLEDVIRVNESLARTPATVRPAVEALLGQSAEPAEAWDVLRRDILAGEIKRRIAADPQLQNVDGHRLSSAFERYRELQTKKRDLVRDVVHDHWLFMQKTKLLAGSGNRLSTAGAELKRRLLLRGERAMRLRQVVARGRQIAGGDPLFDVCPVWMVSPETAAQVFPLEPIFDVVVFDEASQCRLEEALPVLARGRRVAIAGDPKQLPPTRFFESAFAASEDDDEPDTDQAWFEQQQSDVEDLLTAALGLETQQSYLDVHYRSKNAALIEFSNTHFYGSRLQPIPGHPGARPDLAPIRLIRAGGVYEKRKNEIEADAVVTLVKDLLSTRKPPSIGIACFNMSQRDLIVEKLDDLAAEDTKFAKKLAEARDRVGEGTFEGLFVKNLENVQGDERDHMIISTTYGPDAAGKFYRRFGPLAMPGGGRRLNVLVTRARQQVHLVTSIPEQTYRSLPDPDAGQTPGGGWLLFAYLKYADELTQEFEWQDALPTGDVAGAKTPDGLASDPASTATSADDIEITSTPPRIPVRIRPTRTPSAFAESLAHKLSAAHGTTADVYWGNDGFCVDVALAAGDGPDAAPVGVLCDAARFAPAEDLMEWDVFRTGILESQGWKLHRVWTPHFFRDPAGRTSALLRDAGRAV